jgi:hypothetical protein
VLWGQCCCRLDRRQDNYEIYFFLLLEQRTITEIGDGELGFFIGTDTSSRGGSVGSFVVSYCVKNDNGKPVFHFYTFERIEGSTAAILCESVKQVVNVLEKAGGRFVGFSTDAPNVMIGKNEVGFQFTVVSLSDHIL